MGSLNTLSHIFYDAHIPLDLEKELIGLYQSAFSVKEYFELFKKSNNYKALTIISEDSDLKHIICYTVADNCITILNELIDIEPSYVDYLSEVLFDKYPSINKINFNRIKSDIINISSTFRLWSCTNDIVVQLPATIEEYDSKLGKSTKKTIKKYLNKLQRENHDFGFNIISSGDIDPFLVKKIIDMNRLRMTSKHIRSGYDSTQEKNVAQFSSKYGLVTTIAINNKVVAGNICYNLGDHAFGETIAHDNDYNKSRVGQVCFYLTLKHFIEKGTHYYHLMEGNDDYKYRFLGINQHMFSLSIYRSAKNKLFDIPALLKNETEKIIKQLRYHLTGIIVAIKDRKIPVRRKA